MAYIVESFDRDTKVIDFHYPNELLQMNNWELQDQPATLDDILISCRATLKYAIKTGRPPVEEEHVAYVKKNGAVLKQERPSKNVLACRR